MISSVNASSLSQIYRSQGSEYNKLVGQIATGKQINKPSDDFVGFTRAAGISTKIKAYQDVNTNLSELREPTKMAADVGDTIFEDLTKMKKLAEKYASETDTATKATLDTEFKALGTGIKDSIDGNKYGSTKVYAAGTLKEVGINPDDSTAKLSVSYVAGDIIEDVSGWSLSGGKVAADVQTELEKATSFTVKSKGYLERIDRQIELNENLIGNKESTYGALTDIDEVKSLMKMTDLQVRQQSTMSMIAQANGMAGMVSRLYS